MAAGALNTLPLQTIAPECRRNRKNTAVRRATYAALNITGDSHKH